MLHENKIELWSTLLGLYILYVNLYCLTLSFVNSDELNSKLLYEYQLKIETLPLTFFIDTTDTKFKNLLPAIGMIVEPHSFVYNTKFYLALYNDLQWTLNDDSTNIMVKNNTFSFGNELNRCKVSFLV